MILLAFALVVAILAMFMTSVLAKGCAVGGDRSQCWSTVVT